MNRKKWCISKFDKEYAAEISEAYDLNPFAALLVASKGIFSEEELEDFFSDSIHYLTEPYELPDMEKAVIRIHKAIDSFEKIAVFGDYDADGVTSTAMLYLYLQSCGADVVYYIPDRNSEGYGMNMQAIEKIHGQGVKLIISVDNGISACEEAERIKSLGMELIVTDHHRPGNRLPDAVAVIDPYREEYTGDFQAWAGVGVVFKLLEALEDGEFEALLDKYADLVAIGTIGDVVPLRGENRKFVKYGAKLVNHNTRIGITALRKACGYAEKDLSATNIAFTIVPRINAAGRIGSAESALKLLLCDHEDEAEALAQRICDLNTERQLTEQKISAEVEKLINEKYKYDRVIVVDGEDWHGGVIGIVASRMVEKYGKPCIVISRQDGAGKGSGRSLDGFSLYDALDNVSDMLNHFGGHTLAAGFEVAADRIDELRERINVYAQTLEMPVPELKIDCKINPKYITVDLLDALSILEPFGAGNNQPVFGIYNMHVDKIEPVSGGKHCRLYLSRGDIKISAMKFGVSPIDLQVKTGDIIDVAASLDRNVYMGNIKVSVFIKAMRFSSMNDDHVFNNMKLYEKLKREEPLSTAEAISALPTRDLMVRIYKLLRQNGAWNYDTETIDYRIGDNGERLCAVNVSVDVLEEMKLIIRDKDRDSMVVPDSPDKVDLEKSEILGCIKSMIS